MTALSTTIKPLSVVLTSAGSDLVTPGDCFHLGATIHNLGEKSAVIYTYLDERSPELRQWCDSMQAQLALGPGQSGEVTFNINVPAEAPSDVLEYDLVVEALVVNASEAYSNIAPLRYSHRLQVLPADHRTTEASDPAFYLDPQTTSQQPAVIQPGSALPVQVWIENRSDRVDRFHLSCAGLPSGWGVDITYPEDYQSIGLVRRADSLGLNPGDRGQIIMLITPPANVLADIYIPTIRLTTQNHPDLNLLELLYLQIDPIYLLQPTLQILRNQVRSGDALFEVQLANSGNTTRHLKLTVQDLDESKSCHYKLETDSIQVPPQTIQPVMLQGSPQPWWRRPFYGSSRLLNFKVNIQDIDNHPLTVNSLQGTLSWMSRPWWQLLLCALAVLSLLGTSAWLIWWYRLRPPAPPKILAFAAEDTRYEAANRDFARVGWQIQNPQQIEQLKITGYSDEGDIISGPLSYDLSANRLPTNLESFCTQQQMALTCGNVRTDASAPGEYTFELSVIPKGNRQREPISQQANRITIVAQPTATIETFYPTANRYLENDGLGSTSGISDNVTEVNQETGIPLNWSVTNIGSLSALKLIGRTPEGEMLGEILYELRTAEMEIKLPPALEDFCELTRAAMTCREVPTRLYGVGSYEFDLIAIPLETENHLSNEAETASSAAAAVTTELISIEPRSPEIISFLLNGRPAPTKQIIPIQPNEAAPLLTLGWRVRGGSTTQVTLSPAPGSVPPQGTIQMPLKPGPGSTTLTLQAVNSAGQTITQSVVVETYDPTPPVTQKDIAAASAAAATAATRAQQQADQSAANSASGTSATAGAARATGRSVSSPGTGESLSPSELPPRFN